MSSLQMQLLAHNERNMLTNSNQMNPVSRVDSMNIMPVTKTEVSQETMMHRMESAVSVASTANAPSPMNEAADICRLDSEVLTTMETSSDMPANNIHAMNESSVIESKGHIANPSTSMDTV